MTAMSAREIRSSTQPAVDPETLVKSRDYCRDLTKRAAKNFYYGHKLLPEPKRSAMYALYAYMRLVDDIADEEADKRTLTQRTEDLNQWEALTRAAIAAGDGAGNGAINAQIPRGHILWPAFAEMVGTYRVPANLFAEMIAGQRQDLAPVEIPDFAALYAYCYRVASVVGVASLYVWGFEGGEETLKLAVARGIAFQLTNILRDLREDAARGRCYLPRDEMKHFGISADDIARGKETAEFREFMSFQIERAEGYFRESADLENHIARDSRPTLRAMTAIYHGVLRRIARTPERVLRDRVCLSTWTKLRIGWTAMRTR